MNRPRLIRGLRIAWSVAFGLVSLSVALMWFRSIHSEDAIDRRGASGELAFVLSANGTMTFSGCPNLWAFVGVSNWSNLEDIFTIEDELKTKLDKIYNIAKELGDKGQPLRQLDVRRLILRNTELEQLRRLAKELAISNERNVTSTPATAIFQNFSYNHSWNRTTLVIPHWFLVIFSIALTAAPWIHWSKSFSLRTLLIATTLIAVVLALIVYASR